MPYIPFRTFRNALYIFVAVVLCCSKNKTLIKGDWQTIQEMRECN